MASPARANDNNIEDKKLTREVKGEKPKAEKPLEFSDFESAVEMSPAMQRIYEKLGGEKAGDKQKFLERVWDLVANEIADAEGEEREQLFKFQKKVEKMLGEKEHTFVSAHSIFENAIINAVNDGLPEGERITSSDGSVVLKWLEDGSKDGGHFVLAKRQERKPYSEADEPGEYITLVDEKTGKEYKEKKLFGQTKLPEDKESIDILQTEQVKEVFNNLEPAVQKSIIDGLKEQMEDIATYDKNGKEKEEAIAKIRNELAALT